MLNITPEKELEMMNATSDHDQNGYVPVREEEDEINYFPIIPPIANYWATPNFHYYAPSPYEIRQLAMRELQRRQYY